MRAAPPPPHPPSDPAAAATHADPYPYYAQLVREHPLHWDAARALWVAASAEAVTALLAHPACRVRPASEPVPAPLRDTPLGALFARLVRMTDGAAREAPRRAAVSALTGLQPQPLQEHTAQAAAQLAPRLPTDGAALDTFALTLPVHVTAALLGIAPAALPRMVRCTWALVAALSPLATAREREAGDAALEPLLSALADARGGPLLQTFRHHARGEGTQEQVVLANAVGFLLQSCEATAGLIGNALLALGQDAQLLAQVRACRALLPTLLEEVLRYDPPVQNTRRFVAEDLTLCGAQLEAGQTVLLLLAAANRDPALNPEPQRFQLQREQRRHLTFGLGAHACPGSRLATTVAAAALEQLLERGVDPAQWASTRRYRPSLNGRIPLFCAPAASATEGGRA